MELAKAASPEGRGIEDAIAELERAVSNRRLEMVQAGISERESQISELEGIAEALAEEVVDRDQQIEDLRKQLDEVRERNAGIYESLADAVEETEALRAEARGQATRIRMQALRYAARLDFRAAAEDEITAGLERVVDDVEVAEPGQPLVGPANEGTGIEPAPPALEPGQVELDIGPIGDFGQLLEVETALARVEQGAAARFVRFSRGRAVFGIEEIDCDEVRSALEAALSQGLEVRDDRSEAIVIDLIERDGERASSSGAA